MMRDSEEQIVSSLLEEGEQHQNNGDFYSAIESYTTAIKADPNNALAYHKRGWARAHTGDITGEIEDWSKAIEINPQFDTAYADRAVARTAARDYKGAEEDAKTALQLNPELKKNLEPILNNIAKRVEELARNPSSEMTEKSKDENSGDENILGTGRRDFLKNITLVGIATVAASLTGCGSGRLASPTGTKIRWGMIIDLKRCVGCYACTIACKAENHTPPGVAYNVVMEQEMGTYPHTKRIFIPRPCMQCENSSCTTVCPVKATYHREDGIVVVDYDKCIGCKYCIAACPYGARSFDYGHNYSEDLSNLWEQQPSPEYGEHRKRENHESPVGNVRKCTFCLHRITNGLAPACAATCIGNAIHFGNLADANGKCMAHGENLQELLATNNYMRLKEELGNEPRVFYLT